MESGERSGNSISYYHIFLCGHILCSQCIIRLIVLNHYKQLIAQNEFQITCPCSFGTKDISISDISKILNNDSNDIHNCQWNEVPQMLHYLKCEHWLCEECITIHQGFNSAHPVDKRNVNIHNEMIKHIYCHVCRKSFCNFCKHDDHDYKILPNNLNEFKLQIPFADEQWIRKIKIDFKQQFDHIFQLTLNKMNDQAQQEEESKLHLMMQIFERGNLLLNLIQLIISDFSNAQAQKDIQLLKDLSTWDIELTIMELQDETEKQIRHIFADIEISLKIPPFELIHFSLIKKDWGKSTIALLGHSNCVLSLIQLKDGRIASGSSDDTIKIWEAKENTFQNTLTLWGHVRPIWTLIQLKDGRIASGSGDNKIKLWEVKETEYFNALTLTGHSGPVNSIIQMKDGRISSGSSDKKIKIWEVKCKEFKNTLTLTGHNGWINALIELIDGRIASGSSDNSIKIWKIKDKSFKITHSLTGHLNYVWCLIQFTDGRLISGSWDSTLKVWTERENSFHNTLTLTGHNRFIRSLIQLRNGKYRIASGSSDKTIKIWDDNFGEFSNTLTLTGHDDSVFTLIQLNDGRIASGSKDGTIKIWE